LLKSCPGRGNSNSYGRTPHAHPGLPSFLCGRSEKRWHTSTGCLPCMERGINTKAPKRAPSHSALVVLGIRFTAFTVHVCCIA
ncbi:unnamed protein product, partial [Ixodes pacificus]